MTAVPPRAATQRTLWSWAVFDWANNGFATVILTFVFSPYFSQAVAETPTQGTTLWGYTLAASGLTIALASPVAGAVADRRGRLKPWLGTATLVCIAATAMLWTIRPDPGYAAQAMALIVVGNVAFHLALVFYDSQLTHLVPKDRVGRWSGWAWGLGYAGGLSCLGAALVLFVRADGPVVPLDTQTAEHVRIVGPFVALWFAVFALPLFLFVPDRRDTGVPIVRAARDGLRQLRDTFREVRQKHANILRFLIARILYNDGLNTLFSFGGIYVAGTFGMDVAEVLVFGIAINVTAGAGAALFGWVDDRIGPWRTIQIGLVGLLAFGVPMLIVESRAWLWAFALPLGLFVGPVQSGSRSLMVRLAPEGMVSETFGFYQASGKITSFLGPAVVGTVTALTGSQRIGLAPILAFVIAGGLILLTVREPKRGLVDR
ncbi:MAG: MFS transporter [Rhodospirillaceae bacterium]|nr:MFS transporter [Rhodospirillaceae bacterium]